jgi:pyruvate/2-oxoacid:ferredoxin oxidoreductase beta subunit
MENNENYEVIEAMEKFGGSFIQALAQCYNTADQINFIKLRDAFPEYWEEFKKMASKEF